MQKFISAIVAVVTLISLATPTATFAATPDEKISKLIKSGLSVNQRLQKIESTLKANEILTVECLKMLHEQIEQLESRVAALEKKLAGKTEEVKGPSVPISHSLGGNEVQYALPNGTISPNTAPGDLIFFSEDGNWIKGWGAYEMTKDKDGKVKWEKVTP